MSKSGIIDSKVVDGFLQFLFTREKFDMEPKLSGIDFEKLDTDQRLKLYKTSVNSLGRELKSYSKLLGKIQRQK